MSLLETITGGIQQQERLGNLLLLEQATGKLFFPPTRAPYQWAYTIVSPVPPTSSQSQLRYFLARLCLELTPVETRYDEMGKELIGSLGSDFCIATYTEMIGTVTISNQRRYELTDPTAGNPDDFTNGEMLVSSSESDVIQRHISVLVFNNPDEYSRCRPSLGILEMLTGKPL